MFRNLKHTFKAFSSHGRNKNGIKTKKPRTEWQLKYCVSNRRNRVTAMLEANLQAKIPCFEKKGE